jgi:4-hydroxy-3-polyprenylbenzoate decarboxylase
VVEENPSLDTLPILKCWPDDGGKFITLPLVFSKDPVSGRQNVGMYRMHVYDDRTTGMHWHIHKDGAGHFKKHRETGNKIMEVAVALGGDPATIYSATAPLPPNIDEMLFAGFLRQSPVEMVQCKTVDLKVPAEAEFILEGYVDVSERRIEGPFGDHTGYYSPADSYPVFHLKCITRRRQPVYPATVVGIPPMEDCYLGKATERIFLPLLKLQFPEIVDINLPFEGVFHNCAIVSIKKEYPGHAKKIINALWGMGQMMFTKTIIVVDADVDVQNISRTAWKIFNSIDPNRDFVFTEGPLDALDHAASLPNYGSKVGIDATKKWSSEGYPRKWPQEVKMPEEIENLLDRKWQEYGFKKG